MRRRPLALAVSLALTVFALARPGAAPAQITGSTGIATTDPFSLYFGYYLPHQAYIAAQPTPMDTINQNIAQRQYAASTDRSSLYDPISPYQEEELDPLRPYSNRKDQRRAKVEGFSYGQNNSNSRGNGPATYYNRTARYFPTLKTGRGPNQNLARTRAVQRGGGGMGGMPSGMPGMPGPR